MARKFMDKVLGFIGFEEEPIEEEKNQDEEEAVAQVKRKGQVLSLHTQRQVRVVVVEPKVFEDVQGIADHLKNRRPVIVNLEHADVELARRVVDFTSGTTYGLNGNMQKVGNGIFLFVPSNVDIASELRSQDRDLFTWMR